MIGSLTSGRGGSEACGSVGVAVIAGTSFGSFGEGYLRFSYANSVDNILAACERIRAWLKQKKVA